MDFLSIERQLLHLDSVANIDLDVQQYYGLKRDDTLQVLKLLHRGHFQEVVNCAYTKEIVTHTNKDLPLDINIEQNVDGSFIQEPEDVERCLCLLAIAVSALQLFIQANWLGPPLENELLTSNNPDLDGDGETKSLHKQSVDLLDVDSEPIYGLSSGSFYLLLSRTILLNCRKHLIQFQSADWWLMRCLWIHQQLLDERSPTLKSTIEQLIDNVAANESLIANHCDLSVLFHTEAGHLMYYYYEHKKATEHFAQAKQASGLKIELAGSLGKRTRYQQSEVSQLFLDVTRLDEQNLATAISTSVCKDDVKENLPRNVPLDDDTVLNKIQLSNEEEREEISLSPIEQALILGLCYDHRRTHEGQGDIVAEESMAFILKILSEPQNWCVESTALLMRTRWERDSSRRLQRSMAQLEELVSQTKRGNPPVMKRLPLACSVQLPPTWVIQRELGQFFEKIGATTAALEVYLQIELWEEVIQCYQKLGRTEKAEAAIREQLAKKETPSLWCHLGEVTHEVSFYQKAWELSGGHFARAQRCLGFHYLRTGKFEESLPCFEKSLEINALQVGVWFSYGCACMACGTYDKATKAFRRCVTINTDNYEAWANLATAYVKSDQKPRAFAILQEAIKCDYENWRLWENYLVVGIDCGEFSEVIRAHHRLIDIKEKYAAADVLQILVRAINENLPSPSGEHASVLRPKALELFGRVTSKITTDSEVWRAYGELLLDTPDISQTDRERALQFLQKSHRCSIQTPGWEKNIEKCNEIVKNACDVAKVYLSCAEKVDNATVKIQLLSSGRLMLKGILTKIKQKYTDPATKQMLPDVLESCTGLEEILTIMTDCIAVHKTS